VNPSVSFSPKAPTVGCVLRVSVVKIRFPPNRESHTMSGTVRIHAGNCAEPHRLLPGCAPTLVHMWGSCGAICRSFRIPHSALRISQMWGNVGVHAVMPLAVPGHSPLNHKKYVFNVIKCNHFSAQQPHFTLNAPRRSPLHPAHSSANVSQIRPQNPPPASKTHHHSTHVIIFTCRWRSSVVSRRSSTHGTLIAIPSFAYN
jgi:hypothetical protein